MVKGEGIVVYGRYRGAGSGVEWGIGTSLLVEDCVCSGRGFRLVVQGTR